MIPQVPLLLILRAASSSQILLWTEDGVVILQCFALTPQRSSQRQSCLPELSSVSCSSFSTASLYSLDTHFSCSQLFAPQAARTSATHPGSHQGAVVVLSGALVTWGPLSSCVKSLSGNFHSTLRASAQQMWRGSSWFSLCFPRHSEAQLPTAKTNEEMKPQGYQLLLFRNPSVFIASTT